MKKSLMIDKTRNYDEVFGIATEYKYIQDGKYFHARGHQVDEKGNIVFLEETETETKAEEKTEETKEPIVITATVEQNQKQLNSNQKTVKLPKRLSK